MRTHLKFNTIHRGVAAVFVLAIGILSVGIFTVSSPVHAVSVEHYVATTGTDTGNCTDSAAPCETIQYAVDAADPSDTVNVAAGTYSEVINVTKPITLKGAQAGVDARTRTGAETIIQTVAGQDHAITLNTDSASVDGFKIDGADGTNSLGIVLAAPTAQQTHILNTIFTNNKVAIDAIYTDVTGFRASQNLFDSNNLTTGNDGVYLANTSGSDIEVANNAFRNTDDGSAGATAAINVYGIAGTPMTNVRILNNTSDNDSTFVLLFSAENVTIANNTAAHEAGTSILIDRGVNNLTIQNNTLGSSSTGIKFSGVLLPSGTPTTNVTVTGNTITGMTTAAIAATADSIGAGIVVRENTITSNAVGIQNASTQAIVANDNSWGCTAGPGNPGCDSVNGNIVVSTWQGQATPGVPNTSTASVPLLIIMSSIAGLVLLTAGGYALHKARS